MNCATKTATGEEKPILMVTVDGGPDENPRYQKTLKYVLLYRKIRDKIPNDASKIKTFLKLPFEIVLTMP